MSSDPHLNPSFSVKNRMARVVWTVIERLLFRPSPRVLHRWRAFLLTLFGAKLGRSCHIYPGARIWAPWKLECEDVVCIADGAVVYNPAGVFLGSHSVVSQEAYLCGASHDYQDPAFPLIAAPIRIGRHAWICARATVQLNLEIGEGSVLALGAVATHDLLPWTVYAGVPARQIGSRAQHRRVSPTIGS